MSDSRIRRVAEDIVFKWKLGIDPTRSPNEYNISNEDELISFIEAAMINEQEEFLRK